MSILRRQIKLCGKNYRGPDQATDPPITGTIIYWIYSIGYELKRISLKSILRCGRHLYRVSRIDNIFGFRKRETKAAEYTRRMNRVHGLPTTL